MQCKGANTAQSPMVVLLCLRPTESSRACCCGYYSLSSLPAPSSGPKESDTKRTYSNPLVTL